MVCMNADNKGGKTDYNMPKVLTTLVIVITSLPNLLRRLKSFPKSV